MFCTVPTLAYGSYTVLLLQLLEDILENERMQLINRIEWIGWIKSVIYDFYRRNNYGERITDKAPTVGLSQRNTCSIVGFTFAYRNLVQERWPKTVDPIWLHVES